MFTIMFCTEGGSVYTLTGTTIVRDERPEFDYTDVELRTPLVVGDHFEFDGDEQKWSAHSVNPSGWHRERRRVLTSRIVSIEVHPTEATEAEIAAARFEAMAAAI